MSAGHDVPVPAVAPTVVIRSLPARLGTALITVAGLAMALTIGLADGAGPGLRALVCTGSFSLLTWMLWWAPQITLSQQALTIRNAWRTHVLGWGEVEVCRTRWGLSVITPDEVEVRASAAPRRGGLAESFRRRQELREQQERADGPQSGHPVPATAVRPEYLMGDGIHRTNLDAGDAGALITAYAEQVRSHRAEPADARPDTMADTMADAVTGLTSSLNRPVVVVAVALGVAIAATAVLR